MKLNGEATVRSRLSYYTCSRRPFVRDNKQHFLTSVPEASQSTSSTLKYAWRSGWVTSTTLRHQTRTSTWPGSVVSLDLQDDSIMLNSNLKVAVDFKSNAWVWTFRARLLTQCYNPGTLGNLVSKPRNSQITGDFPSCTLQPNLSLTHYCCTCCS